MNLDTSDHALFIPMSPHHKLHNLKLTATFPRISIISKFIIHHSQNLTHSFNRFYGANDDGGDRNRREPREEEEDAGERNGGVAAEEEKRGAREGVKGEQGEGRGDEAATTERVGEAARGGGGRGEAMLAARGFGSGGRSPSA